MNEYKNLIQSIKDVGIFMKIIISSKVKMTMPNITKAKLYAQMARNQFQAASILANSETPKIQSTIWLQMIFLSIELSVKSYLISSSHFQTEKELKTKVNHKFDLHLLLNPKIVTLFATKDENLINVYKQNYNSYIKHEFRYLNLKSIFIGNTIESKFDFLKLTEEIITANIEDIPQAEISCLLNT